MRVLVVAAHPDDEVLGCGGVLARHAARGDETQVVIATRGVSELYDDDQVEQTRQELREAHRVLGVSSAQFLDFPAPRLDVVPGHELADAIGRVVRALVPELMYIPHRGDIHTDHQAVYRAALVAARPIDGCPVRKILSYETLSETEWAAPSGDQSFVPTVYVDIGEYLEDKLQAMACYHGQMKAPPHARSLRSIEALARLRGSTVSLYAAEAFMLVREIVA